MSNPDSGREYLACVTEKLKERIREVSISIARGQKEIEGMHEYYWENYTEMDQYGYEDYDNQQALLHQVNANQEQLLLKQRFRRMLDSPFFGRVDFCYEGEAEAETFYIGIGNFAEKTGGIPLIYDWRAPVSGLFYDYDKGPAAYEAPQGEMTGEITSKRQYKIRRGKMVYEFESDVKIDDEILGAELGKCGEVQLKNIVRTIQKEQNAIIRNTRDRIMVIQGAAGSGKTSIALHRIAYLLYHDRKTLKSSDILILSPNGVFSDYISHILPELGEENIREMSFDLFAYKQLKDVVSDCEDRYDQIERVLKYPELTAGYEEKQSQDFLDGIEMFVTELEDSLMNFKDVEYRGFTKTEAEIIELFYFKFTDIPLLSRMEEVAEYFIDEVETLRGSDMSEEERQIVMEKFLDMYETRDIYRLYNELLEREGFLPLPDAPLEKRKLSYEDVYPMLYLKYRLQGAKDRSGIRHLVIDEMQDYSYLQYVILGKLFQCPMTILGDKAQTMSEKEQDVTKFLPKIFGKDVTLMTLDKSYRSTTEITEYAAKLIGQDTTNCIDRHGDTPMVEHFATQELMFNKIAKDLLDDTEAETKAVLCRNRQEASMVAECLQKICTGEKVTLLDKNSMKFSSGIIVTTFYLSKGLEFDAVFVPFVNKYFTPLYHQALYIEATRALHTLRLYETD